MNLHKLDEFDIELLQKAKTNIIKVYEYHYGDSYMRREIKRLETILNKIDMLIQQEKKVSK